MSIDFPLNLPTIGLKPQFLLRDENSRTRLSPPIALAIRGLFHDHQGKRLCRDEKFYASTQYVKLIVQDCPVQFGNKADAVELTARLVPLTAPDLSMDLV